MGGLCTSCTQPSNGHDPSKPQQTFQDQLKRAEGDQKTTNGNVDTNRMYFRDSLTTEQFQLFEGETEDNFQKNTKLIKLRQLSAQDQLAKFTQLLQISKYMKKQIVTNNYAYVPVKLDVDKYLEYVERLVQSVKKLDPFKESYNDIVQAMMMQNPGGDLEETTRKSKSSRRSTTSSPDKFGGNTMTGLEFKVKRIQEQYEQDVIQKEMELDLDWASNQMQEVQKELKMLFGLQDLDTNQQEQFVKIKKRFDSESSQVYQIYDGFTQYYQIRSELFLKYYQLITKQLSEILLKIGKNILQLGKIDELLDYQNNEIELMSKEVEMIMVAQRNHAQDLQKLYQIIVKESKELQSSVSQSIRDQEESRKKTQEEIIKDIEYDNLKLNLDIINAIPAETSRKKIKEYLEKYLKVNWRIQELKIRLNRSHLFNYVEKLVEMNQQVTTDLQQLNMDTELGIQLEEKLTSLHDQFSKIDEDKGFFEEQDEEDFIVALYSVASQIQQLNFDKEKKLIELELNNTTFNDVQQISEFLDFLTVTEKIIIKIKAIEESLNSRLQKMRCANRLINTMISNEILQIYISFHEIQSQFELTIAEIYKQIFDEVTSYICDGSNRSVNFSKLEAISLNFEKAAKTLEQLLKLEAQESEQPVLQVQNTSDNKKMQPLIFTNQQTKYDSQLYDIMNQEVVKLNQEDKQVEFPVLFKKELNDKYCVYEIYCPMIKQKYVPIKMKIIDGDYLCLKMKSGCYVLAEKIGLYFNELALEQRFGFKVYQNEK